MDQVSYLSEELLDCSLPCSMKDEFLNIQLLEELKEACSNCVAKTSKGKKDQHELLENETYLPLWMHMTDTAAVALKLLENRTSQNVLDLFYGQLKLAKNPTISNPKEMLYQIMLNVALLHDIGKATASFQARITNGLNLSFPVGLTLPSFDQANSIKGDLRRHEYLGRNILRSLGYNRGVASVCGAHHGRTQVACNDSNIAGVLESLLNTTAIYGDNSQKDSWKKVWKSIDDVCLSICNLSAPSDIPELPQYFWMLIAPIVIEADWLASNESFFPLISVAEEGDPTLCKARWEEGWKQIGFPKIWSAEEHEISEEDFEELFGFPPNLLQSRVIQILQETTEPGLMIIEAQMGLGKTEAALAAAEIVSGKRKTGGIYYGLPTRATANGLFPRFKSWASKKTQGHSSIFKLAHSTADLNQEYQKLPHLPSLSEDEESNLFVHDWMLNSKTGIIADFVIGTVDQGLMMALKHKHVMLKHLGMAQKTIIIDEIHAYDAYMNIYFDEMLTWLGQYRVPVILLSATLPKQRKQQMVDSYLKGLLKASGSSKKKMKAAENSLWVEQSGYPLITWTDGLQIHAQAVELAEKESKQKEVHIEQIECSEIDSELKTIGDLVNQTAQKSGCAGVIVNTVARSQKVAHYLKEMFPDLRVVLMHSRFTDEDRAKLEAEILDLVGKTKKEDQELAATKRNRLVVVGTQVIEQSLDIDFDVLISELAPVDLLLQRSGRLQRHSRENRPAQYKDPTCYILNPDLDSIRKQTTPIYQPWYLDQTKKRLPQSGTILIPDDIPKLVEAVYSSDPDPENRQEVHDFEKMRSIVDHQKGCASVGVLKPTNLRRNPELDGLMNDVTYLQEDEAMNAVRQTSPTLEVILLKEDHNHEIRFLQDSQPLCLSAQPDFETIQKILRQRVSIPAFNQFDELKNELQERQTIFTAWQRHPMLRNVLFLVLDHDGRTMLKDNVYAYSEQYGLQKTLSDES